MTLGFAPQNDKPYPLDLDFGQERDDLEQAIYLSLFCNKRDITPNIANQNIPENGWFGNLIIYGIDFEQGSYLWTLSQAQLDDQIINEALSYVEESLDHLVEDNVIIDFEVNIINDAGQIIEDYEEALAYTKQKQALGFQIKTETYSNNSKIFNFNIKLNGGI